MKVTVIGAGPAGSYVALNLAKKGYSVTIYEDHDQVGIPFQCTGLTTSPLTNFIKLNKNVHINTIKRFKVFSPNNSMVEFKLKEPEIVLDRIGFDKFLAEKAVESGAKLQLSNRFIKNTEKEIEVKTKEGIKNIPYDYLIGADGPFSAVAKSNYLFGKRKYMTGYQARIKMEMETDVIEVFLGYGVFAWIVPEPENIVRIGLVTEDPNPVEIYNKLLKNRLNEPPKTLDYQTGLIPIYDQKIQTQKNNIFLVGDAATQVKASTLGGIIPGMRAGLKITEAIEKKQSYPELSKDLNRDLWIHLKIYETMKKFKENDFDNLLYCTAKPKVKELIETFNRDYPSKFAIQLLLHQPSFLKFTKFLL